MDARALEAVVQDEKIATPFHEQAGA
jgi:hypothetical protein